MSSKPVCKELQELRELLECPVCFYSMRNTKIRICKNGHSLCDTCYSKIAECPICRSRTWGRSITLENIGKLIPPSPCQTSFAQQYQLITESSTVQIVYNPTLTVSGTSIARASQVPEMDRSSLVQPAISTLGSTTSTAGIGHSRAVNMATAQFASARSSRLPISSTISYAMRGLPMPRNEIGTERRYANGRRPRSEVVSANRGRNATSRVDVEMSTTRHVQRPAWR